MDFDIKDLSSKECYKLLTSVVVPRPIAFVTTKSAEGHINAAPYSYFNLMGQDPPLVVLGAGDHALGQPKDTVVNLRRTGEFVVNLVSEEIAEQMHYCSTKFPHGVNELDEVGLTTAPSIQVAPPRVAESPFALECREVTTMEIGRTRLIVGRVVQLYIRDDLIDPDRLYVAAERAGLVGRMHGGGWYTRTSDLFEFKRLSHEEWLAKKKRES